MKLSSLKVNAESIEAGAWVNKIPEMGDVRLKVCGFGNTVDLRIQKEETDALPRAERVSGISADANFKIMTRRLEALLLDWDGFIGDDDQPISFSKELAADMLPNPEFMRFRDAVIYAASVVGEQNVENGAKAVKN